MWRACVTGNFPAGENLVTDTLHTWPSYCNTGVPRGQSAHETRCNAGQAGCVACGSCAKPDGAEFHQDANQLPLCVSIAQWFSRPLNAFLLLLLSGCRPFTLYELGVAHRCLETLHPF